MPTTQSSPPPTPMGVAAAPRPKRYDEAFKRQAVENWSRSGTQIARELGISYPALKEWKRRYFGDANPTRPDLVAENRALKAELQRVRAQADTVLQAEIRAIHTAHRGRKRIARLLRHAGLWGLCSRRSVPRTTDSRHTHPIAPNHSATHSPPTGPNQIWVADLTYVPTATVLAALRMALTHRHPPVGMLYHTDRGVQYASVEHRAVWAAAGIEASMSRTGNPYDNAAMESFMAAYKRECVALAEAAGGYATPAEATADFFAYVELYYNRRRRHSALGYQSPLDLEANVN